MPETLMPPVASMVVHCANVLQQHLEISKPPSGLVVGCGNGNEVVYLCRALHARRVVGIDVEAGFSPLARAENCVFVADAKSLPFRSEVFEFAASFHSLEHVGDPHSALDEIQRVLRPGGWFYAGVPNKSRLVGYLGSFDATTWQKITWNLTDWRARLGGQFQNESGAHAGFDQVQLLCLLKERFAKVNLLTAEFVRFKYGGRLPRVLLDLLLAPSIINYSVPAHYALCQKAI